MYKYCGSPNSTKQKRTEYNITGEDKKCNTLHIRALNIYKLPLSVENNNTLDMIGTREKDESFCRPYLP